MSILFDRLKQLGKEAKDLAEATGIDAATLYNYRDGKVELGIYKATEISLAMVEFNHHAGSPVNDALLSVDELFGDVLEYCAEKAHDGYLTRGWHVRKQKEESENGERSGTLAASQEAL